MLTGVILAGGDNKQWDGRIKALLPFAGKTIIEHQIQVMKQICSEVIVVVNDPKPFLSVLDSTVKIITDYIPGKGPLSGMHAAFSLAKYNTLWVVACDMPYLSYEAALLMWEKKGTRDAVVPFIKEMLHPLHAIYDKRCLAAITQMLNHGEYVLTDLFKKVNTKTVEENDLFMKIDPSFVEKVNKPEGFDNEQNKKELRKI